jgi:hypothetical protein
LTLAVFLLCFFATFFDFFELLLDVEVFASAAGDVSALNPKASAHTRISRRNIKGGPG